MFVKHTVLKSQKNQNIFARGGQFDESKHSDEDINHEEDEGEGKDNY